MFSSFQNPNANLPGPTLTDKGKSYKSTAEVIDYLVSISSTNVAPETAITKVVHEDGIDPNFSMVAAVRTSAISLIRLAYLITTISEAGGMMKSSLEYRAALQAFFILLFAGLAHLKKYAATPEAHVQAFYDRQITKSFGPPSTSHRPSSRRGQAVLLLQVFCPLGRH